MSVEDNFIVRSGQNEKSRELQKELDAALLVIKSYEAIIEELKLENSNNLKHFTHELANPLQILSMTIESIQDHPPKDLSAVLDRMKRSADSMTSIILSIRKLRNSSMKPLTNLKVVI